MKKIEAKVNDLADTKNKKNASESLMPKSKKSASGAKKATKENRKTEPENVKAKGRSAAPEPEQKPKKERKPIDENSMIFNLLPYLLGAGAVFTAFCFGFPDKTAAFGEIAKVFIGLLSHAVWAIPIFMFFGAIRLKNDMRKQRVTQKLIFSVICTVFLSVLSELIFIACTKDEAALSALNPFDDIKSFWSNALLYKNGGVIGGALGMLLDKTTGSAAIFIASFVVLLFGLFEFGFTPEDIFMYAKDKMREKYHDIKTKQHEPQKAEHAHSEDSAPSTVKRTPATYKVNRDLAYRLNKKNIDIDIDDKKPKKSSVFDSIDKDDTLEKERIRAENLADAQRASYDLTEDENESFTPDSVPFDIIENTRDLTYSEDEITETTETITANGANETDIAGIFADGAIIEAGGMAMNTSVLDKDILDTSEGSEVIPEGTGDDEEMIFEVSRGKLDVSSRPTLEELYSYPSTDLLTEDPNPATFTVTEELKETALKLVETLSNFGVHTKITNICCGPTVTRYELQPEIGVRVKAIQNLSDDIALHLAAAGVRIEAPIPGKNSVGIEIPNKTVSTVYIRNLLENPQFRSLKSRISVCLGMDVAGSPVFIDIAKMPHLLIAGATGMGKSVCINSFILSILFKARPDEVKFILIDPKQVEFTPYKGIPHLLVPVVSDPKKAAGSLAWAVSEMERRFELIKEVGARNIAGYNDLTKDDPEKPPMCQIVIIIDELADLMMTAKDEVENSICRLAQKARAAGMHLVIGTQRPSVDVVTGLIKANVPSRIACTVASQVDSRTIIDVAGAEKLLGKGDMLFSPVGSMKPIRVQGSFVSDSDVEAVAEYLKKNFTAEYDKSIIDDIEREAAKCGEKKKGKSFDSSDDASPSSSGNLADSDEMIMPAIQVALSAGQLSTSLLQRKLSLGYARAARIVDILEQMGVVSGFEGSKPRRVLITEEQFLEMKMRQDGSES